MLNSLTANVRMDLRAVAPGVHGSLVMPGIVVTDFARNAGSAGREAPPTVTRPGGADLSPQSVEDVTEVIARLLDQPVAEMYTNPAQPGVVRRYLTDVGAFETRLERGTLGRTPIPSVGIPGEGDHGAREWRRCET